MVILRTGGQTWYNYFIPPALIISVGLAHHEIFRAKVGKGGVKRNLFSCFGVAQATFMTENSNKF